MYAKLRTDEEGYAAVTSQHQLEQRVGHNQGQGTEDAEMAVFRTPFHCGRPHPSSAIGASFPAAPPDQFCNTGLNTTTCAQGQKPQEGETESRRDERTREAQEWRGKGEGYLLRTPPVGSRSAL